MKLFPMECAALHHYVSTVAQKGKIKGPVKDIPIFTFHQREGEDKGESI